MRKVTIVYLIIIVIGFAWSQTIIKRTGIAIGYISAPSAFLFRTSVSGKSAWEMWVDLPKFYLGDNQGFLVGIGGGYAMFLTPKENTALYFRPGGGLRYRSQSNYSEGTLYFGAAIGLEVYLDSLGLNDWDVLASAFIGSSAIWGKDFSQLRFPLFNEDPFGICIGIIKYF